jgi:DNA segregation ATPase FtsK/SpoIIIE-like protein
MRYVGNDDEFDDDEEYYDDDDDAIDVDDDLDDDEDEESPRSAISSRVNPFTNRPSTPSSSGLPGSGRSSVGGSSPSSASRLPGSPGANRPLGGTLGASGSSTSSSSRLPGTTGPNRPGSPTTGSSGSAFGGSSSSSGSRFGGSSSSSGSSYGGSSSSSSGSRFGGSGTSGSSGSSGSSYGGSSSSSSSGSRFGGSGTSGSSGSSSSSSSTSKPDDKSKSASSGGIGSRLGGLASRLPGAKSDDKKPASSGGSSSSGGIGARLGSLTGRGSDSGSSSASKSSSGSSSGGIGSRLGGLTSRLPGVGKGDDKKPASGSSASSSSTSRFGGSSSSSAAKPASASTSSSGAGAAKKPLFGSFSSGGAAAKPAAPAAKSGGKSGGATGIARFLPFLNAGAATKPAPKARASKAPKVESEGLSLDSKLDILGVVLILGSLALFFSALSSTKGQLTEAINNFLSSLFGWGAVAIPIAMMAVGLWLVARHFGDEPPVVPTTRIIGIVMIYIGILLVMQFIDTFNYVGSRTVTNLDELKLQMQYSYERLGAGGGWLGAQLYYLLVANITEFGAFFAMLGWLVIGFMFTLSISAAELAMIIISIGRSFNDNRKQRAQRRAAAAAALQAAQLAAATAAPALTVSKEQPEALPGGAAPALPATASGGVEALTPALLEAARPERSIAINVGGRTLSAHDEDELVPVENKPAPTAAPAATTPAPATSGGLGARLRGIVPGVKPSATPPADKSDAPQPATSMRDRLLGRGAKPETPTEKPAEASPSIAGTAAAAAAGLAGAAISAATSQPAETPSTTEEPTTRLGDLMRPAGTPAQASATPAVSTPPAAPPPAVNPTAGAAFSSTLPTGAPPARSPFARPVSEPPKVTSPASPPTPPAKTEEELEAERLASLPPARPRGTGPLPRPDDSQSRFAPSTFGATAKPGDTTSPADRQSRLDAIRSGNLADVKPEDAVTDKPATPSENQPAAASVADKPAQPTGDGAGVKPSMPGVRPFGAPATPGDKSPQPAKPFWQTAQSTSATPLPKEEPKAPAAAYGKPTTPPGVVEPPRQAPAASVEAAAKPDEPVINAPRPAEPPPPSAGVGRNAPAGMRRRKEWKLPNTSNLLMPGSDQEFDRESLLKRAKLIEDTLTSFGAPGKVVEVNTGPVITQFGVEPDYLVARGGKKNRVKVGAIAQLDKDIQLALGAKSIRIEAPVPGKGYVGIEVPNEEASLVSLRDVMESDEFKRIDSPLTIALGQSVDGTPIAADLSSMPHLLIAGTTGSGKSVCVNAIITSLLILNSPDMVKFIMVDPKRVELTGYNGIPHLVAPVVVELERIVGVLKWVTREMDERYKKFSNAGARNIEDYNKHLDENSERMPYIVVIIDELADLMMLAPDETERVITRIAALARATGIHLVIATQRPSVDVVTGLIKANFPARIAFAVAGGVDSRVILDQPGAEKLLGRGDMLYMSGDSPAPLRLQGVYVSDTEINNIVRYWRAQVTDEDIASRPINQLVLDNTVVDSARSVASGSDRSQIQQAFWDRDRDTGPSSSVTSGLGSSNGDEDGDGVDDELYEEAVEMVRRLNKASVSLLQRRLRIGYTRAARLIDMMEEQGIVGPATEGSKPREVLPLND